MRFTTSFLFASGLMLAGTATAMAWPATTRSNANVRGGPGINYNLLGTLPAGAPVEVVGCAGAWCQTAYGYVSANLLVQAAGVTPAPVLGGAVGTAYRAPLASVAVPSNYIPAPAPLAGAAALGYAPAGTVSGTPALAGQTDSAGAGSDTTMAGARTTIGTTNVRSGPGTEYDVVKTLPDFTKVEVTGCANGWCQTNEGYISLYLLSRGPVQQVLNAAAQPRVPGSQTRDAIASNAATQAAMGYGAVGAGMAGAGVAVPGVGVAPGYSAAGRLAYGAGSYAASPAAPVTAAGAAGSAMTTTNVNVRSGPGVNYNLLGTLPAGAPVSVVSCAGSWCQTQYGYVSARLIRQGAGAVAPALPAYGALGGAPVASAYRAPLTSTAVPGNYIPAPAPLAGAAALGYAPAGTASATPVLPLVGQTDSAGAGSDTTMAGARTTIGTTNVRSGPGTEYDVVKTLPDFTKVEVTGCANGWCQTNEGYISLYLLSRGPVQQVLNAAAQPRVPGSQTRDAIASNAATQAAMGYGAVGAGIAGAGVAVPGVGVAPGYSAAGRLAYGAGSYAASPAVPVTAAGAAGSAMTTTNVNVRSGPGVNYNLLGTLPAGAPVSVVSCAGSWCQTQYGYVSARLITQPGALTARPMSGLAPAPLAPTTLAPTTFAPGRAYAPAAAFPATAPAAGIAPAGAMATAGGATYSATTTQAVNLRTGPGTGYDVLATLPAGTAVGVRGCTGSWCETVDGYVSARHLSGAAIGQSVGQAQAARVIVRPAPARAVASSRPTYADPMLASDVVPAGYEVTAPYPGPVYPGIAVPPAYPVGGAILAGLAAPFIGIAAAVDAVDGYGGYGYGYGTAPFGYGWGTAWRASWGPGYWGPGLYGRNGASYWGARTSYWGGRPSYANMHPGYPNIARFGDRNGDTYWSRRGEGRLPQRASFYSGLGPRWQGPYAAGPSYNGRPVMWRPRAARW